MKCDHCGKMATVHVSQGRPGHVVSRSLCEECARLAEVDLSSIRSDPAKQSITVCERCGGPANVHMSDGRLRSPESHLCQECALATLPQYEERIGRGRVGLAALLSSSHALSSEFETFLAALKELERRMGHAPGEGVTKMLLAEANRIAVTNGRAANAEEVAQLVEAAMDAEGGNVGPDGPPNPATDH